MDSVHSKGGFYLVLLQISKSCKRTDSGKFVKKSADLDSDCTKQQKNLDTWSWPTHQSPHQPTHNVSQSLTVQACQVI